jgi:hypothetical protein
LALEQSVIRLARGGVINFSIIGLLVMTSGAGRPGVSAGAVFLILAIDLRSNGDIVTGGTTSTSLSMPA